MTIYRKRESPPQRRGARPDATQNGETLYRAAPEGLSAERPDGARLDIPWTSVRRARLRSAPDRARPHRRLFGLDSPSGLLIVDDYHLASDPGGGRARFERRADAFNDFVAESAARIEASAPDAGLYLGLSLLSFIGRLALGLGAVALGAVAILAFVPALIGGAAGGISALALLVLLAGASLPRLLRWAVRARPRRVDAAALAAAARHG